MTTFQRARVIALAGIVSAFAASQASAQTTVQVGILSCVVSGGAGFIIGSTKSLDCTFQRPGPDEGYTGTIQKFGLDIGGTTKTVIQWAVLAPSAAVPKGALAGTYGGVTGEATIGVGLGANVLVGGLKASIALQPLSVQAQQGLNIAAGIASLTLTARH